MIIGSQYSVNLTSAIASSTFGRNAVTKSFVVFCFNLQAVSLVCILEPWASFRDHGFFIALF